MNGCYNLITPRLRTKTSREVRIDRRHRGWWAARRRLQSGQAAAEHRIDRKLAEEPEDGSEKRIVRSEHHCRADEKSIAEGDLDRKFALAALSDVL
jgi:hypothetical protein